MATDRDDKRQHPTLRGASAPEHDWDRQVGESARAYAAFIVYRDLGDSRSLAKVGQRWGRKPARSLICRWSSRHAWVARVAAWDHHERRVADDARREERLRLVREMEERHLAIAIAFQSRIVASLQAVDPMRLSPSDMVGWLATAVKVERLALGVNTENVHQETVSRPGTDSADVVRHIINDPESARLAHELLGLIADADAASGYTSDDATRRASVLDMNLDAPTTTQNHTERPHEST